MQRFDASRLRTRRWGERFARRVVLMYGSPEGLSEGLS